MANYTTSDDVLAAVGVSSDQIPSTQMNTFLKEADAEVDRFLKTTCKPKVRMHIFSGDGTNNVELKKIPLLNIRAVEVDETDMDIENVNWKQTGVVQLTSQTDGSYFVKSSVPNNCKIKYEYGWLEETDIQDESQAAVVAGTNIEITIVNAECFIKGQYAKIEGFDGNYEVVKILATEKVANTITCNLNVPHEGGSLITQYWVPAIVSDLATSFAAIKGAAFMIGNSYTFATSYTLPDYSITKGVPYPHFQRNLEANIKRRDDILGKLSPWPVIA